MPAQRNIRASTEHRRGGASGSSLDAVEAERLCLQELEDRKRLGCSGKRCAVITWTTSACQNCLSSSCSGCDGRAAHKEVGGHFHVAVQTSSVSWCVSSSRCRGVEPGRPCSE